MQDKGTLGMDDVIANLPAPVMIIHHHKLVYANDSFWEFYLPEEAKNYNIEINNPNVDVYSLVKKNSRGAFRQYLNSLNSIERQFETILIAADKEYTPVLISGRCLNPHNPIEDRIHILTCMDISQKIQNEFLLYEMLEKIDEIFFVIDVKGDIQYINKRGLMFLKMNEEDIINLNYLEMFPEFNWPHLKNLIEVVNRTGMPLYDKEITARMAQEILYFLINIIPIYDMQKTHPLYLITLKDITKFNVKINLATQLEKILQSIPDPMIIVDKNMEIRMINNVATELKGINPMTIRDAIMPKCSDILTLRNCGTANCPMYRVLEKEESIRDEEVEIPDSYGKLRWFMLTIIPLEITGQTLYLMRYSDITAKKEYERELTIYQEKLKQENFKLQEKIGDMKLTPVHETSQKPQSKMQKGKTSENLLDLEIEVANSYLSLDPISDTVFNQFIDLVHSGVLGLVISRIHPDKIRKQFALKETPIVWVNNSVTNESKNFVQPNLQFLLHSIKSFMKETASKNEKSVILIDCIEYLTIYNDFKKIIQFIEVLNENVTLNQGILLINIDPDAFEPKEMALIRRGMITLEEQKRSKTI